MDRRQYIVFRFIRKWSTLLSRIPNDIVQVISIFTDICDKWDELKTHRDLRIRYSYDLGYDERGWSVIKKADWLPSNEWYYAVGSHNITDGQRHKWTLKLLSADSYNGITDLQLGIIDAISGSTILWDISSSGGFINGRIILVELILNDSSSINGTLSIGAHVPFTSTTGCSPELYKNKSVRKDRKYRLCIAVKDCDEIVVIENDSLSRFYSSNSTS